jgi:hypothetical protein
MGLGQGRGPAIDPVALSALVRPSRVRVKITGRLRHLKLGHFGNVEPGGYGVSDCDQSLNGFKFKVVSRSAQLGSGESTPYSPH